MNLSFEQIENLSPNLVWDNSLENITTKQPSSNLKSWLTETNLLTNRIKESGHKYAVQVLKESLSSPPMLLKNKNDARNQLMQALNPILTKYMSENNIQIILEKKYVIMANSKVDLTNEILKLLDNKIKSLNLK